MKQNIFLSIIFITLLLSSATTEAFDGNRKGFVFGGGVELASFSTSGKFENLYYPGDKIFVTSFSLGYAFNNNNKPPPN